MGFEMTPADDDLRLSRRDVGYVEVDPAEIAVRVLRAGEGFRLDARGRYAAKHVLPGLSAIDGDVDVKNALAVVVEYRGAVEVEPDALLRIEEVYLGAPDVVRHPAAGLVR